MTDKKTKWLIYTVLVGLIPILSRLLVWLVTNTGTVNILSPSDFVIFGLVLHISNINEIEHFSNVGKEWKTIQNGFSIVFIAFYSVLYSLTLIGGKVVDFSAILYCSIGLAFASFLISYSLYNRISRLEIPAEARK